MKGGGRLDGEDVQNKKPQLTPSQALVIAGLLTGVLEVDSVLVSRDQVIEIVLVGYLKQSSLKKLQDKIGEVPLEQIVKALLDSFA